MHCLNCGSELVQHRPGRMRLYCSRECSDQDRMYRKKNNLTPASKLNEYQLRKYQ